MAEQRLIDANALLKSYDVAWMVEYDETGCGVRKKAIPTKTIEDAPTIDAVEVVHGRWKEHYFSHRVDTYGNPDIGMECSVCGFRWYSAQDAKNFFHYCPNCGAKMDAKDMNVPTKDEEE